VSYHVHIKGCYKPYVRMTQRGKWVRKNAQQYLSDKTAMQLQLKAAMVDRPMLPRGPMRVQIIISHDHGFHHRDLDNEIKATIDAMQGIVFKNDCWVDRIDARRCRGSECSVSIYVAMIEGDGDGL